MPGAIRAMFHEIWNPGFSPVYKLEHGAAPAATTGRHSAGGMSAHFFYFEMNDCDSNIPGEVRIRSRVLSNRNRILLGVKASCQPRHVILLLIINSHLDGAWRNEYDCLLFPARTHH